MTNAALSNSHYPPPGIVMQAGNLLLPGLFSGLALADSREIFSRNLKHWLDKRGVSGAELARRLENEGLGVTRSAVSHWLRAVAAPDVLTIGAIAEILEIPVWYLFHAESQGLPDLPRPPKPKENEAEKVLKFLADRLDYDIRLTPKKRPK